MRSPIVLTAAAVYCIEFANGLSTGRFRDPSAHSVWISSHTANHNYLIIPAKKRKASFTELLMSPLSTEDEKVKAAESSTSSKTTSGNNAQNPKIFFSIDSSAVRSSTQTDAIGQQSWNKKNVITPNGVNEEQDDAEQLFSDIPPSVLQPFTLLILSQFILFIGVGAVIPTIPIYGQSIGLSSTSNGIVISAPAIALLLISRNAGEFADIGRKTAMMGGMALIALSDVGTALSNSLLTLIVARLGLGLGRGYAEAGERGMLTDLANQTPNLRGRALALQQAAVALGVAIGAPLGGMMVEEYGARSAFLCVSAAAVVALGIYSILPETVLKEMDSASARDDGANTNGEKGLESNTTTNGFTSEEKRNNTNEQKKKSEADWINLLKNSPTWRNLALCQSGTSFGYACKMAVVPILASTYLPGGATGAGFLLSAAGLAGLVGAPLGGFLTDQIGARKAASMAGLLSGVSLGMVPVGLSISKFMDTSLSVDGGMSLIQSGETVVASSSNVDIWHSTLAGLGGPEAAAFSALIVLWSIGASAQGPSLTALAQEMAPVGAEATALGLPRAAGDGTYIIAPLILGYVSDSMGGTIPGIACTVAGGALCLGSLALYLMNSPGEDNNGV